MQRLVPIVLLSIISSVIPQQVQAAGQIKAGASCTVVNSTQTISGRKFTCVKSGLKLVWNKGVIAPKTATPVSSTAPKSPAVPNPFSLTPFPDEFTRAQMVEATLNSFDAYIKQSNSNQAFKLVIDKDFEHKSKEITKVVGAIFSSLPYPSGYPTVLFVVTRDRKMLENSIKEFSDFYKPGPNQLEVRPCLNCSNVGWASTSLGLSNIIPHEIFHTWQSAVYNWQSRHINADPSNLSIPPVWLDEGGAEFFGNIFYRSVEDYYPGSLVTFKPYRLQDYRTRELDGNLPYSLGRLASEYIVASKGYEKFLSIYSNVGQGQDFPTAFENALGISLENFYDKFNKNLQKML
jgi:hypothetical protein